MTPSTRSRRERPTTSGPSAVTSTPTSPTCPSSNIGTAPVGASSSAQPPAPHHDPLAGAAAVAANDFWAVGSYSNTGGPAETLTVHWDGSSWSFVPSPPGLLNGVAAVSSNDVWAGGSLSTALSNTVIV